MRKSGLSLTLLGMLLTGQLVLAAGALDVRLVPAIPRQGKCFAVAIVSAEGVTAAQAAFLGREFSLFKDGDDYKTVIGIAPEQKPGKYPLSIIITRGDNSKENLSKTITVGATKFPVVSFWLKPAKKKLLTSGDLIAEEWARIEKVLIVENPNQGWSGKFLRPAGGPVSMVFGSKEYVNRQPRGQHRGLDLAVMGGTKIKAANNGKVVFVEKLSAFGGTVVIDHGQGIHTLYFHLSKFLAEVGQVVTKGEVIALSGNTGISSGPHLHWGMSAHNLRVDPVQWTRVEF